MNQSYFEGHSQNFQAINGEVIHDDNTSIKCQQDQDGNTLCILDAPTCDKSLIETLENDFPLAKLSSRSTKKSTKKPNKKSTKTPSKKSTKKSTKKN